jgi:hypothetical protein
MDQPVMVGNGKKKLGFFCYLIRLEHEKCSEMCVWSKIEKLGPFLVKNFKYKKSPF